MSGLAQISAYCSSSDSDAENQETEENTRYPLPSLIRDIKGKTENHVDIPEDHGGRVRSFPHERGNWASFIYIPFILDVQFTLLIKKLKNQLRSISEFSYSDDFHISLSKTVVLKYHWISTIKSSLKEISQDIESFSINFDTCGVYCNEEKTRTFLGLRVSATSHNCLISIVADIDSLLKEFRLEPFYKDPSFHMSLLWCVGDQKDKLNSLLPTLNEILQSHVIELYESNYSLDTNVTQLCFKTGNKLYNFALK